MTGVRTGSKVWLRDIDKYGVIIARVNADRLYTRVRLEDGTEFVYEGERDIVNAKDHR